LTHEPGYRRAAAELRVIGVSRDHEHALKLLLGGLLLTHSGPA
jgi:hypothetical protein